LSVAKYESSASAVIVRNGIERVGGRAMGSLRALVFFLGAMSLTGSDRVLLQGNPHVAYATRVGIKPRVLACPAPPRLHRNTLARLQVASARLRPASRRDEERALQGGLSHTNRRVCARP
jgi:hypothetical protein